MCILKKKSFENFSFFLQKYNFLKTGTCKFKAKTQKQTIFRQNLLSNYYSALNYHSNGTQYRYIFLVLKIFKKISKFQEKI